jgi:hypothetical protein
LTRSVIETAHLRLGSALAFNPLGPLFFALALAQVPYRAVALATGRELPRRAVQAAFTKGGTALVGVMGTIWLVKVARMVF